MIILGKYKDIFYIATATAKNQWVLTPRHLILFYIKHLSKCILFYAVDSLKEKGDGQKKIT